jgi:protein deglycase
MKKILLLLAEGFEIYEASVFIDVMGWNLEEGDKTTKLCTCALKKEIKSTFNQHFLVDFTVDEIKVEEFDALAIPGGFEQYHFYRDAYSKEFSNLIREFNEQKKPIASICTGAFPVAKSGILNGKKGTTYNKNPLRQQNLRNLGVNVVNSPIVVEGNIITSWNPSTAMDVAFLLLEKLTSKENTQAVKGLMGFDT